MYLPGMSSRINHQPLFNSIKTSCRVDLKNTTPNCDKSPTVRKEQKENALPTSSPPKKVKKMVRIQTPKLSKPLAGPKRNLLFESTSVTNIAATQIQRAVRGRCARTNTRIKAMEYKLATMESQKEAELQAIQDSMQDEKMAIRRKLTHKLAKTVKKQLACAATAGEGSKLIQFLRSENMKLRKKNEKLAASMFEMKEQNARLEEAMQLTAENQKILESHFVKIQETHDALMEVVPKYEAKIKEMTEALDTRRQYCLSEHKMKVMYVKLVGTLGEMVEHHSNDKELIDEVLSYCLDLGCEDDVKERSSAMLLDFNEANDESEYDEVSVKDDDEIN